jgi:hypothetical protein
VHACIIVTSSGTTDNPELPQNIGYFAPGNDPTGVDVCGDGHAGQLNISIVGVLKGQIRVGGSLAAGLGFLAGLAEAGRVGDLVVKVNRVTQGAQIDPGLLKFLQAGPFGELPLKPSSTPPTAFGLMKTAMPCIIVGSADFSKKSSTSSKMSLKISRAC